MSNHAHILVDTSIQLPHINTNLQQLENCVNLNKIMKRIKGASARFANLHLQKTGSFWEADSYDMYIRNEKMLDNVIWYILNNPVKAKIVKSWNEYKWNFITTDI